MLGTDFFLRVYKENRFTGRQNREKSLKTSLAYLDQNSMGSRLVQLRDSYLIGKTRFWLWQYFPYKSLKKTLLTHDRLESSKSSEISDFSFLSQKNNVVKSAHRSDKTWTTLTSHRGCRLPKLIKFPLLRLLDHCAPPPTMLLFNRTY